MARLLPLRRRKCPRCGWEGMTRSLICHQVSGITCFGELRPIRRKVKSTPKPEPSEQEVARKDLRRALAVIGDIVADMGRLAARLRDWQARAKQAELTLGMSPEQLAARLQKRRDASAKAMETLRKRRSSRRAIGLTGVPGGD